MSVAQMATDGAVAVHMKRPTKKARTDALRTAARKERIAPGVWRIESGSHAGLLYTVSLHTDSCQCPAGAANRDCWHKLYAQQQERRIEQDADRQRRVFLKAELLRLKAEFGDGLFWLAVEEVELMPS